jgi:hypothetical protein
MTISVDVEIKKKVKELHGFNASAFLEGKLKELLAEKGLL